MSTVIFEKKARLAIITLNRPDKMNALNSQAVAELVAATEEIEKNDDIRVVIVTGAGQRAFSSGSDLTELQGITAVELRRRIESPNIIRKLSKPVVRSNHFRVQYDMIIRLLAIGGLIGFWMVRH